LIANEKAVLEGREQKQRKNKRRKAYMGIAQPNEQNP
jgi:hypothetical protein